MKNRYTFVLVILFAASSAVSAQGTLADYELIVLPGAGHGAGGSYGERKRFDFFVHHLLGVEPPNWNKIDEKDRELAGTGNDE